MTTKICPKTKIEYSLSKSRKIVERAQQVGSRNCGKDKSLLRFACKLGYICNNAPITSIEHPDKRYVNPMTSGSRLFLEEMGTYKCVEFKNGSFKDKNNNPVILIGYTGE